ncbi:MAG: hypothetical protein ACJ72Z_13405 [Pyrinomonadaceae bacterium]
MKKYFLIAVALFLSSAAVTAQKSGQDLSSQLRGSKIKITYDAASGSSKLMGVAENFSDAEAKNAKIAAMNFAIGFFFPGQTLDRAPEQIKLTFWVMSKKPQFAEHHSLEFYAGGESIPVGEARYAAKGRENMEYLNFEISRDVLIKIASYSNVQFKLGDANFTFSRDQLRMFADLLIAADPLDR